MVFTSHIFVFWFLPLVLAVYHLLPASPRWRNPFLLLASWVFYGWSGPSFLVIMVAVTAVTFVAGLAIGAAGPGSRRGGLLLALAVALCLASLFFLKYFDFALSIAGGVSSLWGGGVPDPWGIVLPAGVSFYTFHAISYCSDVRRGTVPAARSFTDYACYVACFPQLIAGPIVRYAEVASTLQNRPRISPAFASGVALFILGFAKKVLLADPLAPVADAAFGAHSPDAATAWFGAFAYSLQLYFDFSGYSDMAVGLGRLFGFEFIKNFNAPYLADGIADFWRRWHISLGNFLRDYLYVPLGGNQGGTARTCRNLLLVMLVAGLWHGANWTFVVWGALHGVLLAFGRISLISNTLEKLPRALRILGTFLLVLLLWVVFRSDSLSVASSYYAAMAGLGQADATAPLLAAQVLPLGKLIIAAVAASFLFAPRQAHEFAASVSWTKTVILAVLFAASLLALVAEDSRPFLYFQF